MRTQAEIVARLEAKKNDTFGFGSSVLLDGLDFEHAKPFLKDGVTAEQWNSKHEAPGYGRELQFPLLTEADLKAAALDYLKFAWGKAEDHRGISAARSVKKMTEFCWLLGIDIEWIEAAEYAQYGCPILKRISELLGAPTPDSEPMLRMMRGEPCRPDCNEGCGSD